MLWYLCVLFLMGVTGTVGMQQTSASFPPGASAPGDIIIGGLFPLHRGARLEDTAFWPNQSSPQHSICVGLNVDDVTQALAMIQAVEEANRSQPLSRLGIRLGYHIHDSCSDVSTALRATIDFTQGFGFLGGGDDSQVSSNISSELVQPVMAVVGAGYTELSVPVAQLLTLEMTPQISYSSTAEILSDKESFPTFLRTVPNDDYQVEAMVKLLRNNNWTWVGLIGTRGQYGRSVLGKFIYTAMRSGICLAFSKVLPHSVTHPRVNRSISYVVHKIRKNTRAKVIVSFAKPEHMRRIFEELVRDPAEDRVWIASDAWSDAGKHMDHLNFTSLGKVIGFFFKSGNISSFRQYLKQLNTSREMNSSNDNSIPFMREYYQSVDPVSVTSVLLNHIHPGKVFSIQMAIAAISQAVAELCSKGHDCKTPGAVKPWQLLHVLQNITFEKEGRKYRFDENGNINLGYDISIWSTTGGTIRSLNVVAEYHPHNNTIRPTSPETELQLSVFKSVVSKCSNTCQPGEVKKTMRFRHTCCYKCIACPENHYSNETDMDECLTCNATKEWAPTRSTSCQLKSHVLLDWNDGFAIVLLTLAALGLAMTIAVAALFLWQRNTPVVRATGGPLSQVILFSLIGSFISVVFFVGQPSDIKCKVRQVLFGLSFTLCVSCILVKSLKILLAFQFNPSVQQALRRLYKPYIIIGVCMGLQVVVCILWLVLRSPKARYSPGPTTILVQCDEGSYAAFGTMLAFIAFLALVCFGFAFKVRKLPESYNEARCITFGMLIYLMSWVIFIPVYVTTSGKYLPAVEMVVILLSNGSIFICQFLCKCYIILFKKEHNTKKAFQKNIYEYSQQLCSVEGNSRGDFEESAVSQVFTISHASLDLPISVRTANLGNTECVKVESPIPESTRAQIITTGNLESSISESTPEQIDTANERSIISESLQEQILTTTDSARPLSESAEEEILIASYLGIPISAFTEELIPEPECLTRTISI